MAQEKESSPTIKGKDSITKKSIVDETSNIFYKNKEEKDLKKYKILTSKPKDEKRYKILTKNNSNSIKQEKTPLPIPSDSKTRKKLKTTP